MNLTPITSLSDTTDPFEKLARSFAVVPINNSITIPAAQGSGTIKRFYAANGLQVINWDIQLHDTLRLQRKEKLPAKKSFSVFYTFTQDHVHIHEIKEIEKPDNRELKNIVFASTDSFLEFVISPLKPVRMIEVIITDEWLENEYAINNRLPYPFYAIIMKQKEPVLFTEPAFCNAYNLLLDIYKNIAVEVPDSFYIRTKMLSLLSDIFESVGNRNAASYKNNVVLHEKMITVEKILQEHLNKTLPSIKNIARQVALSESTLKRNFKALYGTTIYEYYLQQKMKKARELFDENPRTVKEVAYMLGYEKVSNFIQMFKKHYHFLPGNLKKMHRAQ